MSGRCDILIAVLALAEDGLREPGAPCAPRRPEHGSIRAMEWGDVPSWVGIALSLGGAGWAYLNSRKAKIDSRKAKIDAAQAEERSDQALIASQSMASSSNRMADSLAEIAHAYAQARPGPGELPTVRKPAWNVEYRTGNAYVLRNVGTAAASHVLADAGTSIAKNLPVGDGVTLEVGQGHQFLLIGAWGAPVPTSLEVTCAELGTQHVSVPAKR